ncbi:MAG: hypothetical protein HND27_10025 [Bacteroidetes bacterium]|nr:hypothetical protein [Bacteroidota bacterium]MBV6461680.1 hypothetical protein [Flavobacteriales bacterium]WKZ75083.1 MAG: hypothetical protein QY303_13140 [Vicingaceae bacterium]MCL4815464.1 hypothetical protein [Flavobacteriales bacterium]NOG96098.1 hypothetical protein [Bacteroidota bacterium]
MKLFISQFKKIFFLLCVFQIEITSSQSLMIKEQYDEIEDMPYNLNLDKFLFSININNFPLDINEDSVITYDALLGDRFAHVFSSFLTMYKTTGDKGYLHKFISQTYFVQQFRNDKQIGGVNPNNNGKKNV